MVGTTVVQKVISVMTFLVCFLMGATLIQTGASPTDFEWWVLSALEILIGVGIICVGVGFVAISWCES